MRFRTKERPRGVLRRKDQRRLTLLVVGFGLILLCVSIVRRPAFWNGLFPAEDAAITEQQAEPAVAAGRDVVEDSSGLRHDEFLTTGSERLAEARNADSGTVVTNRIPFAETNSADSSTEAGLPRIPDDLLKTVKDDVIGVHSAEDQAYFTAMKLAQKIEQRRSLKAPRGAYALFIDSPAGARGIPWKIEGQLRRLSEVKGKTNAFGVGMLYDAWITTPDSGDQLVHVIACIMV